MRTCTSCGSKLAPYQPRKRVGDHMLCPACAKDPINGTNVSVQRPPEIDIRGVPLDSGLARKQAEKTQAKAPSKAMLSKIANTEGWRYPTTDSWQFSVDGIEGHDIPPRWRDDGQSPYPWVKHDPDDRMFRTLGEMHHMTRQTVHPLASPLPVRVWENYHRRRALLGHAQVIPQQKISRRAAQRVTKAAHKHVEHHGYGGQHWHDMDDAERRAHMIKWHGWNPTDYDDLNGDETDEHTYGHETGVTGSMAEPHQHGEGAKNHHHPASAGGLWSHLTSHYHAYPDVVVGKNPQDSDEGYDDLAALHDVGHNYANGSGTAHLHGADGLVGASPTAFDSMHGDPPDGFASWDGFLHHMQKSHGWGQGHDITSADLGALDQKHDEEHTEFEQAGDNPVHSHSNGTTYYHQPLVDPLDKHNEEVKYHLDAYHDDVPYGTDPGALLVHHSIEHAKAHYQTVPHEHTSPEVDNQIASLKTPYIPHPKVQKEHLQSHIALHHPEADSDAILDAQSQWGQQGAQALAHLHDKLHDDIDTDVAHTHAKPLGPAEQTVMTANADHAPHDYETDALTHLVEHHGLVPGEHSAFDTYKDTHQHLHEMWENNNSHHNTSGGFGMAVNHDHGQKWAAEAELAKQPPTNDGSNLQADLLKAHMTSPSHNFGKYWLSANDPATWQHEHEKDHDASWTGEGSSDKAKSHGPHEHLGLPDIHPDEPLNMPVSNGEDALNNSDGDDEQFTSLLDHLKGPLHGFGDHIDATDPVTLQELHNDDHHYGGYYTSPDPEGKEGVGAQTKAKPHPHDAHQGLPPVTPPHATASPKNLPGQVPTQGNGTKTYTPEPVAQGKQWQVGREGEHYLSPVDVMPHPTGKESAIEHLQMHHPEVTAEDYENSPYKQDGYLKSWHGYLHGTAHEDHPEWTPKDAHLHDSQEQEKVPLTIPVGSHMVHDHAWSQDEVAGMTPAEFHKAHEQTHMHNDDESIGHSHAYPAGPMTPPTKYLMNPEYAHLGEDHPEVHHWYHGTQSNYDGPPLPGDILHQRTGGSPRYDNCADTYPVMHATSFWDQAKDFSGGNRIIRGRIRSKNPKVYNSIHEMNHDFYERAVASGHLQDPDYPDGGRVHHGGDYGGGKCCNEILRQTYRGSWNDNDKSAAQAVRDSLRADGHDGVMWRNQADSAGGKKGPWNASPLDPDDFEVIHRDGKPGKDNLGDAGRWQGAPGGWPYEDFRKQDQYPDADKVASVRESRKAGTLHADFPVAPHPQPMRDYGTGFHSAGSHAHPSYDSGDDYDPDDEDENEYCSDCGTHGHSDSDEHCENCNEYGHASDAHDSYCPVCEETNDHGDDYKNHHDYCDYCNDYSTHESSDHEDEYGEHPTQHKFEDYCPHCGDVSKENREASECNHCGGALPDWSKIKATGAVVPPWHKYLPSKRLITSGQSAGHYEDIRSGEHTDEEMIAAKKQWQTETGQMQAHGQGALFSPQEVGPHTVPPIKGAANFDHMKDLSEHLYRDHGSSPEPFHVAEHTDDHGGDTEEGYDDDAMQTHHQWLHLSGQANAHGFPATEHNHYTPGGPTVLGTGMDTQHLTAHMVMHHGMDSTEAKRQLDEYGAEHLRATHDAEHQTEDEKPWADHTGQFSPFHGKRLQHAHHDDALDIADLGGSPEDLDTHVALEHKYHGVPPKEFADDPKMREAWHNNAHALGHPQDYLNHSHLADGMTHYTGKYTPTEGYSKNYQAQPADVPALIEGKKHLLHQHGTDLNQLHQTVTLSHLHSLHGGQHNSDDMILPHSHVHPEGWADFGTDPNAHLNMAHGIPAEGMEEPSLSSAHNEDHDSGLADHHHALLPSTSDAKIHPLLMPSALANNNSTIAKTLSEDAHLKAMHGINATGPVNYLHSLHKAVHASPETNEAAGGHEIDHDHYPEGAVIGQGSGEEVAHVKGVNDQGGADAGGWKDLIGHMKSAHPHLTGSGYLSHYLPSNEGAQHFHDLHEQAHAEGGDAHHTHAEDPSLPLLGSANTWANDKLAKHMNSEHGYAQSVLEGFGSHDQMVHHHLTSHANGYADDGPHAHDHSGKQNFSLLHDDPVKPDVDTTPPVAGDKTSMHNHLLINHAMSLPDATTATEMHAMHDTEHDPAGLPNDMPTHKHVSLEGINHYQPQQQHAELIDHIHQAHGYNTEGAALVTGESDPEKQHSHMHWQGMGLPNHPWHEHPDVANPFPPHQPTGNQYTPGALHAHMENAHGWGEGDLSGHSATSMAASHDHMHSAEWMANNGLTQMPGHYHPLGGGVAKLHGPEMKQPDHNPVALSNHLSVYHNVPYPKTQYLTSGEQDAMHEDLHNTPFLTHHTHAAPPASDPAAGQWQTNHLHDPQNFDELGHHMLTHHAWNEMDLPSSPHGPALPDHPHHADETLAGWHVMDHDDGTDSNFQPLSHQHPPDEGQHPPMADWEHELMGNVPTPHPTPHGVQPVSDHIGSWHGVEPNLSHYSEDLGHSGVGAHHHDLHLPGGGANHTHLGMGHFATPVEPFDDHEGILNHLQTHHGYTPEQATQVVDSGHPVMEHSGAHELHLPGSETHTHLPQPKGDHLASLDAQQFFEEALA